MPSFSRLIRFESIDGRPYFADLGAETSIPVQGVQIKGYRTFEEVGVKESSENVVVGKLLAPLPYANVPIYCVGLNYKSHAEEAHLKPPVHPPLWTKPAASLADPDEIITMNKFCATTFPDYEGELVFVTSRTCKDISISEAPSYILGYTCGNDLSCRMHQLPDQAGGQFFFAKAFDKFAPIGPILISPEIFGDVSDDDAKIVVRVNGEIRQQANFKGDLIFNPATVLSRMRTTIPAGTAVMTGTCAGVGAFMSPRTFLASGDVVEVEVSKIGILRNKIVFT